MKFQEYMDALEQSGQRTFVLDDVVKAMKKPRSYVIDQIYHKKKKGVIISPLKGFYVIIPHEYRHLGSLPSQELIVYVMRYLKLPYYTGLLTAANYHGATHHALFVFQVVTAKRMPKAWMLGKESIQFIFKKDISHVKLEKKTINAGTLLISSPEETAKDIMTYYRQSGGLNHQATVLSELTASIDTCQLIGLAKRSKGLFWLQRMGYILEKIDTFYEKDRDRVVEAIAMYLATKKLRYVPLAPEMPTKGKPRHKKWHIIENTTVESDV